MISTGETVRARTRDASSQAELAVSSSDRVAAPISLDEKLQRSATFIARAEAGTEPLA